MTQINPQPDGTYDLMVDQTIWGDTTISVLYCSRAEITKKRGAVAEVPASYVGKIAGAPNGICIGPPDINRSRHQGSVSFTTTGPVSATLLATVSWTVRFVAKAVTFRYLTNQVLPPGFDGHFFSQALPYLGTENILSFRSGLSYATGAASTGYLQSTLVFQNVIENLQVNDLDNGWYEVSEIFSNPTFCQYRGHRNPGSERHFQQSVYRPTSRHL